MVKERAMMQIWVQKNWADMQLMIKVKAAQLQKAKDSS